MQTVFISLSSKIEEDAILLTNFILVLSDSAAYMHGCNNGVFK